jgi:hypothetical protein
MTTKTARRRLWRILTVLTGVPMLVLVSPSAAMACGVTYQGGDPNAGCSGTAPVVGAIMVGAAAASAALTLALLNFIRGTMSHADFNSVLATMAALDNPATDLGVGARPQPPATAPPDANPYRPEIANQVPPYGQKGVKTTGILDLGNGRILPPQDSTYDGPALRLPRPRRGMNRHNMSHVEAHAAAQMRLTGTMDATLYLNRVPCPGRNGCDRLLPRMVPPDGKLTIYGPGGYVRVVYGEPE